MKLSFKVWPQNVAWSELQDFWAAADELPAYRTGWIFDHFVPQTGWNNHDPLADGRGPCYEAWTSLALLAATTRRVRLGTLVSSMTHRHPGVFAKMISTLDHVSGGRVEVGLGSGWNEAEAIQFGLPFPAVRDRFDELEEYLQVLDRLLGEREPAFFSGQYFRIRGGFCDPPPVQSPRPPFTVGGKGPRRALPIVARWADHWNFPSGSLEEFTEARARLIELLEDNGRSPSAVDISVQHKFSTMDGFLRSTEQFGRAGAQHVIVRFLPPLSIGELTAVAEQAAAEFDLETTDGRRG
jgi:alkanesulfonate monooxygenase SsuD/methylene tetrahydromethanopterin reductase-like flavin-dependent oxidoreductase (luciferase family)